MKKFLKPLYVIISIIILALVILTIYDIIFTPKYFNRIISGDNLESKDKLYLINNFNIKNTEIIILFYGENTDIKNGGSIITNLRVIRYLKNDNENNISQAYFKDVTIKNETTYLELAAIHIKKKDNTGFIIPINNSENCSINFYNKINSMLKK